MMSTFTVNALTPLENPYKSGFSDASRHGKNGKIRLTSRGRFFARAGLLTSLLLLLLTGYSALTGASAGETQGHAVSSFIEIVVTPGESLWSIAGSVAGEGVDIRTVVGEIMEANGLASAELTTGQRLFIPTR